MIINNNIFISIGSNLRGHMHNSKRIMDVVFFNLSIHGLRVRSASKIYISKPSPLGLGPVFYNRVISVKSDLNPIEVLYRLKKIERTFSVRSKVRNSPRVLDLDIIDYKGKIIKKRKCLQIPHPRMNNRDFILKPLHDISPYWISPITGHCIKSLLYQYKRTHISIAKPL
jgi:2-amino-4-hydroxy-6-hydroxymethyldihydropteridine diphosphokinase